MKVLLVNGSPHKTGCTHTALNEIAKQLHAQGIETEELWCGVKPVMGCIGCGKCKDTKRCWYDGDGVNEFLAKVPEVDAFVFGSPIHFAGTSGSIKPFMDRAQWVPGSSEQASPPALAAGRRLLWFLSLWPIGQRWTSPPPPSLSCPR